jgi:hypothetical protein
MASSKPAWDYKVRLCLKNPKPMNKLISISYLCDFENNANFHVKWRAFEEV